MISGLLEGIRIIDFTNYLPGPFATQRLAELGAEVIKVEAIEGDPARHSGMSSNGTGIVYLANNRSKKSVSLNLKDCVSQDVVMKLIKKSDVVLESFRPGVMQKFGLDYESVKSEKSDIVYCSLSGYGNKGEWSLYGSHDINYLAISGVLSQLKDDGGKPIHPSITLADYFGSFAANERILAGLTAKERTGSGSYHCIAITDVLVSMMGIHLVIQEQIGEERGLSELNGDIISYAIYETEDGRYMSLGALETKFWRIFCDAVGRPEWISAHFSVKRESNPVFVELRNLFLSRPFPEWVKFSREVDCCLAPVLEVGELEKYPYFRENRLIYRSEDRNMAVRMHGNIGGKGGKAPEKGEHLEPLLKEILSMSEIEEIE